LNSAHNPLGLNQIKINLEKIEYDPQLYELWKNRQFDGNYDRKFLMNSKASSFIKDIIFDKAEIRPDRFFGEAYVATKFPMLKGWYNNYTWLKWKNGDGGSWIAGKGLKRGKNERKNYKNIFFQEFILNIIGRENLKYLHEHSKIFQNEDLKTPNYPKAPDLCILDKENNLVFIEVKMPGDKFHPLQIIGLKMIKKFLRSKEKLNIFAKQVQLVPK
jgi:hypothetical protein